MLPARDCKQLALQHAEPFTGCVPLAQLQPVDFHQPVCRDVSDPAYAFSAYLLVPPAQYTAGSPGYKTLAEEVERWEHQPGNPAGRLFYLALPPYVYPEVRQCKPPPPAADQDCMLLHSSWGVACGADSSCCVSVVWKSMPHHYHFTRASLQATCTTGMCTQYVQVQRDTLLLLPLLLFKGLQGPVRGLPGPWS